MLMEGHWWSNWRRLDLGCCRQVQRPHCLPFCNTWDCFLLDAHCLPFHHKRLVLHSLKCCPVIKGSHFHLLSSQELGPSWSKAVTKSRARWSWQNTRVAAVIGILVSDFSDCLLLAFCFVFCVEFSLRFSRSLAILRQPVSGSVPGEVLPCTEAVQDNGITTAWLDFLTLHLALCFGVDFPMGIWVRLLIMKTTADVEFSIQALICICTRRWENEDHFNDLHTANGTSSG